MSRTLKLADALFNKLAHGAAQRGLSIEALLAFVSEIVVLPDQPTKSDHERHRRVERLFAKYQTGTLTAKDRAELNRLIDTDYQDAIARADQLIAHKKTAAGEATEPHDCASAKPDKRTRK